MIIKEKIIKKFNSKKNLVRIDKFIESCLHEKNAYYNKNQPIGSEGDFTTAPEISQMFGEILGLYVINHWKKKINRRFNLVELGPGKGTLFKDILRVSKIDKKFISNAKITFIEKNKKLISIQKNVATKHNLSNIKWKKEFDLESNLPSIIYSNEFFDCLSIRQFFKKNFWMEKFVKYNKLEDRFILIDKKINNLNLINKLKKYEMYDNIEISKSREKIFSKICQHIKKNKGLVITIDYGYDKPLNYFTLQSVFRHKKTHIFDNIGNQDITSLVNFEEFINIAKKNKLEIDMYCTQKEFLFNFGINERKKSIKKNLSLKNKKLIDDQFKILTSVNYMGNNFKVLIVSSK